MYAQEILSRNDMLGYVERLLGKNRDLFEQFKCIIAAIGAADAPAHDDSWHSVPLSEIDFSRCRRCTPSYRALPRDYPNPPCSERSEEELKVLNDVWVSLPVGSEESYTFRHMRKNQYEEVLFRVEDMRFEIDMCVDGNASTLRRLEKLYDELLLLSKTETSKNGKAGAERTGLGGKSFQYTLDGRVLSVIHKHTIKRIYGDDGPEMLDLCFRNPAVAIPIVVNRLRQKDQEWRAAKEALNRKWKDLAEFNYYKSLDHRSITWRTTDKRATSTRTLVAEIKDRAVHNGYEGEQALNLKKDKAKEEHGSFYEVTMGTLPRKMDLSGLPKPTSTLFTPHLSNKYSNCSWAQQDALRIICFALERGSASPADKERCYRLWRDFLAPWFELGISWMQSPAVSFVPSLVPEDEDEEGDDTGSDKKEGTSSADENNEENGDNVKEEVLKPTVPAEPTCYFSVEGHLPFPPGTTVSTTIGEAKVVSYNKESGFYEVTDSSGAAKSLPTTSVFCTMFPIEPSDLTEQLRANDEEVLERPDDNLMIGTQCMYLFFRLHQILVRRLNIAKTLANEVSKDSALGRHIEKLSYEGDPNEGKARYDAFISLVYSLLEAGGASSESNEGGKYEDRVRCLLGNQSFELLTMDKLISHILKNLQHMANDDTLQNMIEVCLSCQSCHVSILALFSDSLQLMQVYQRHKLAGSFKPTAFREEAALLSDGENMYAFQICNHPSKDEKILHYEFLGCISEEESGEEEGEEEERESNKRGETISFISHTLCILVHKTCTLINVLLRCQVLMR
jgi:paired amphipathic helix protein Sin3a